MSGDWIQTHSGKQLFPLRPDPAAICIEDVAHALSQLCRYTGHTLRFYSVGEHSVRVARYLLAGHGKGVALYGLLHDASEAYLQDLPRPLKVLPEFAFYRKAEATLQALIYQRFGLSGVEPEAVKHADMVLLSTERLELLGPPPAPWGALPEPMQGPQGFGWTPEEAQAAFLGAFGSLGGLR